MDTSDQPPPAYHRRNSNPNLQVPMSDVQRMSMEDEERPLPEGWIRQFDRNNAHHFYVDTRADPPRSIWHHPFDDEQWTREHAQRAPPPGPPPGSSEKGAKPAGENGTPPRSPSAAQASSSKAQNRGFLGKIKDELIGTKEEREAAKQRKLQAEREMQQRYLERRRLLAQQAASQQAYSPNSSLYNSYGYQDYPTYAAPQTAYGRRGGFGGGGGYAVPLLGGLAGGLLLGDIIGGGFGGDGGFGGGGGFDGGGGGFFSATSFFNFGFSFEREIEPDPFRTLSSALRILLN